MESSYKKENVIKLTDIEMQIRNESRLKAYVTLTFDHVFVVKHVRIVMTDLGRLVISMPTAKIADDRSPSGYIHKDMAHPITREFRTYIEDEVFKLYYRLESEGAGQNGQNGEGFTI